MSFRRFTAALLAAALLLVTIPTSAGADSLDELEAKRQAAEVEKAAADKKIDDLTEELEDTDAEMAQAYIRLKEVRAQLPLAQAELDQAEGELINSQAAATALADRLKDARSQATALKETIATQADETATTRNSIAELARRAYRGEANPDAMSLVVGADSAEDFAARYALSQTALRTQTNSLTDLQQAEATARNSQARLVGVEEVIADLKTAADAAVVVADAARLQAETKRTEVTALISQENAAVGIIEARRDHQIAKRDEQQAAAEDLSNDIQDLIGLTKKEKARLKEEAAKAAAEAKKKAQEDAKRKAAEDAKRKAEEDAKKKDPDSPPAKQPDPVPTSEPRPPSTGFLGYPTANVHITSSYGWRLHPVLNYWRLHAGTDFRAYCGTAIYASAAGEVQWSKMRVGLGNQVLVDHGTVNGSNLMTSYNHLSRFAVRGGQNVKKGQLVGYSGNTGTSTACHLHFEVYVNGLTVNPMSML